MRWIWLPGWWQMPLRTGSSLMKVPRHMACMVSPVGSVAIWVWHTKKPLGLSTPSSDIKRTTQSLQLCRPFGKRNETFSRNKSIHQSALLRMRCTLEISVEDLKPIKVKGILASKESVALCHPGLLVSHLYPFQACRNKGSPWILFWIYNSNVKVYEAYRTSTDFPGPKVSYHRSAGLPRANGKPVGSREIRQSSSREDF